MSFGLYSGEEFFKMQPIERKWLIEGLIKEKDSVLFVGDEKSGKSICAFQIMASATSGHPFLDTYAVPRPFKTLYLQLEGEIEDSRMRFERMRRAIDVEPRNMFINFSQPLNIEAPEVANNIIDKINQKTNKAKIDLMIVDPLYFAMSGSISDDIAVRKCLGQLRRIKDKLNCALMVVHHTHKSKRSNTGKKLDEGDEAVFGSKFLKAYFDHTILFTYDKKTGYRTLSCTTQRSGTILREVKLKLVAPDPLLFERLDKGDAVGKEAHLYSLIPLCDQEGGISYDELKDKTGLGKTLIYGVLTELVKSQKIEKFGTRPVLYRRTYTNELGDLMTLDDVGEDFNEE